MKRQANQIGGLFCEELLEVFRCRMETLLANIHRMTFDLEHVFIPFRFEALEQLQDRLRVRSRQIHTLLDPYRHELVPRSEWICGDG